MGKLDGPDGIDEARWEKMMDAPQKRAHHERCRCDECVPHVRHDAASIEVDHATDAVTYPCGRAVYSPDEEETTHTGGYHPKDINCPGCMRAREARIVQASARVRR